MTPRVWSFRADLAAVPKAAASPWSLTCLVIDDARDVIGRAHKCDLHRSDPEGHADTIRVDVDLARAPVAVDPELGRRRGLEHAARDIATARLDDGKGLAVAPRCLIDVRPALLELGDRCAG